MRYRLQYLYSILVFFGVLACSFFLVSRESGTSIPFRTIEAPPMRAEASPLAPGVTNLFDMENAIATIKKSQPANKPEESNLDKPNEPSERNLSETPEGE